MIWQDEAQLLKQQGKSWTEIANALQKHFPDLTEIQRVRKARTIQKESPKTAVGVIGDTHIPFEHENYLQFLIDTFKTYRVGRVVHIGDIIDHHAMSRFQKEPQSYGAKQERELARLKLQEYYKAFPKLDLILGNHDERIINMAASVGIDRDIIKGLDEIYGIPKGWNIHNEIVIDDVLYKHGVNCGGADGALRTALLERMSTVIGHYHSGGGVKYSANKRDIIFGLNAGCGISISQYAFAYGTHAKYRPTLGCGVVFSSTSAIFVPMSAKWFRN